MRIKLGLDAVNLFLADVRAGLGPYLAVYLLTERHWDEARIGIVLSVAGIAGLVVQTPAGALVDAMRSKRGLLVAAAAIVALSCLAIPLVQGLAAIILLQVSSGAAEAVFAPLVSAITLGLVGRAAFARRIGRNEAWNHVGNAAAAVLAALGAAVAGPIAVFWLLGLMALGTMVSVAVIPGDLIDHERARGADGKGERVAPAFRVLLECRPLLVLCLCAALFHLANAAMLPLVGQKLALADPQRATQWMSGCIIAAQAVMVPAALLVGRKADSWGRKALFLAGFAILPIRGVLYVLSDAPAWLLGVQFLDGVGAGIFGALVPLIVGDLTRGTGRFNVSQGAVATAQGVGAALSTTLAGAIVTAFGYGTAFLCLGAIALGAALLFAAAMPETAERPPPSASVNSDAHGPPPLRL